MSSKTDMLTQSEAASDKEVGTQDNGCWAIPQHEERTITDTISTSDLDKLAVAVDGVAGKLGVIEVRL